MPRSLFPAEQPGVSRLYTVAMMAELLGTGRATIRHWTRRGFLAPAKSSGAINWYDYAMLVVARDLARLLQTGLSLRELDRKLRCFAGGDPRQAAQLASRVVVDGRRLSLRQDATLLAAGGQLQFGFYCADVVATAEQPMDETDSEPGIIALTPASGCPEDDFATGSEAISSTTELLDLAAELDAAGNFFEAAEALRAVLQADGPSATVTFMLAETLYRAGDVAAARERYYTAVELDADHLEARTSLGCVLAEQGDFELAAAALEGVLRQQPDYADAHWHMAGVLAELRQEPEARRHLITFLELAPESPWADVARERLAVCD
jgi:tetratricopeptide (TPR) repeat protein